MPVSSSCFFRTGSYKPPLVIVAGTLAIEKHDADWIRPFDTREKSIRAGTTRRAAIASLTWILIEYSY
jgi:hypothetical protein